MANPNSAPTAKVLYDNLSKEDCQFRLVQFASSASATEVELTLCLVSWNDPPSYHALSHIREDPTPTRTILVDGNPLPVNHNLHQALLALYQGGHALEWFWVDAICIDQDNPEERSWHVAQRGQILDRATLTHIWLGPSSVVDLWLGWPSFSYSAKTPEEEEDVESAERRASFLDRALDDGGLRSPRPLDPIEALMSRPSWYRTWAVQEIALARNGLGGDINNNLLQPLGLIARRQRRWGQKPGLLEFLMSNFMGAPGRPLYKESDPRDIIFGLLGVAADTERLCLRPDYTETTAEVYTAATRAMVERCRHYSLDYSTFPKDIDDLPTWVPAGNVSADSGSRIPAWCVLRQRGFSVNVVTAAFASDQHEVGTELEPAPTLTRALASQGEQRTRVLQAILAFAFAVHPYFDATELETVLWQTLVADYPIADKYNTRYNTLAARIFRQQLVPVDSLTEEEVNFMLRNTPPYPRRPNPAAATQAQVDEYSELLLRRASDTCRGRTLFATAGGRLGLGPERMQTGDVVTILFGTTVPIVLRPAAAKTVSRSWEAHTCMGL